MPVVEDSAATTGRPSASRSWPRLRAGVGAAATAVPDDAPATDRARGAGPGRPTSRSGAVKASPAGRLPRMRVRGPTEALRAHSAAARLAARASAMRFSWARTS
eukprot:14429229-Alexandrium_andersonii.AAC.1